MFYNHDHFLFLEKLNIMRYGYMIKYKSKLNENVEYRIRKAI